MWEILLVKSKLSGDLRPSFGYHTRKGCGCTQTPSNTSTTHQLPPPVLPERHSAPALFPVGKTSIIWESHSLRQSAITSTEVTMAKLVTSWEINCTEWISWGKYRTGRWGTAQQISLHLHKTCITWIPHCQFYTMVFFKINSHKFILSILLRNGESILQGTTGYCTLLQICLFRYRPKRKTRKKFILLKYEDCAWIPSLPCHTFLNYILMPNYWSWKWNYLNS